MDGLRFSQKARRASPAMLHRSYRKVIRFLTLLQCRTQVVVNLQVVMSRLTIRKCKAFQMISGRKILILFLQKT